MATNRTSYSVWFNGVLYSHHASKGAALDAAHAAVNQAQHVNHVHGQKGSEHCRATAEKYSRLLGVLASVIPVARSERSTSRFVMEAASDDKRVSVRRDTF